MVCYSDVSMIVIAVAIACAAVLLGRTLEPRACGEGGRLGVVRTVACAVVSGLVGMRLLRRQFAKAGMTA